MLLQFGLKLGLHLSAVLLLLAVLQTSNFDGGGCDDDDDDDGVFLSMESETRREFQMACIYRLFHKQHNQMIITFPGNTVTWRI
jgi:hypothetical protein